MKTNIIMGKARIAFVAAALCISISQSIAIASPSPQIMTQYFIGTAAGSTNNSACLQNIMSFMDKSGVIGYIPTDFTNDPRALDMPHVLRGCQILSGPAGFALWDSTNDPTGNFAGECGSRIFWGYRYSSSNQFLASQGYFHFWSSDFDNTLYYAGNLATNTDGGAALTFSSTLRGEVWNADGTTTTYTNGETIADHPINVVIALPRESYYVTDMTQVASDLNYFKDEMTITNFASFTMYDGSGNVIAGTTNQMSSVVYIDPPVWSPTDGNWYAQLEGQRLMGFTYYLLRSPSLSDEPVVWNIVAGGPEGFLKAGTSGPNAFFRGYESNGIAAPFSMLAKAPVSKPVIQVSNGNE